MATTEEPYSHCLNCQGMNIESLLSSDDAKSFSQRFQKLNLRSSAIAQLASKSQVDDRVDTLNDRDSVIKSFEHASHQDFTSFQPCGQEPQDLFPFKQVTSDQQSTPAWDTTAMLKYCSSKFQDPGVVRLLQKRRRGYQEIQDSDRNRL
jgi:hypothetical protein